MATRMCFIAVFLSLLSFASPDLADAQLPLKPERQIKFSTDEGTWISLDVSPNGKTIVFDLLGQLYTLPIEGGKATRITSGMAFNSQPRYSPDGRHIVFTSDASGAENVWIADADGSHARAVSKDQQAEFTSPVWFQDGKQILVSRRATPADAPFELWQYSVDGGSGVRITDAKVSPGGNGTNDKVNAVGPVVSPDGKYVYYSKLISDIEFKPEYGDIIPKSQIMRLDRFTGEEVPITRAIGSAFRPLLSPDGTKMIYGTRYGAETALKLIDMRTGDERWLVSPVQHDDQESKYGSAFSRDILPGYAFTPDGKHVVLTYGGKIHRIDIASGAASFVPFTAQASQGIGPSLAIPIRVDEGPVKWRVLQGSSQSPDDRRLAFSAGTHVYVMNVGEAPHRLTRGEAREYQPVWSPDGRWIAYVTWSTQGGHIWKVPVDGGEPTKLTSVSAYYRDLAWSLDSGSIIAVRGPRYWQLNKPAEIAFAGGAELLEFISVPSQGGEATRIGPANDLVHPHFVTAQPDRIFFFASDSLASMHLDGTDRRTHLKIVLNGEPSNPLMGGMDAQISQDGKWIAARASNRAYLIPAPALGGEAATVDLSPAAFSKTALPVRKLSELATDSIRWSSNGSAISWTVGSSYFRLPVAAAWAGGAVPEEIKINLAFARATPRGVVLLRGAKVITMRGDEIVENSDILVRDNRISRVGARGSFDVPREARVIDVSGSTIVPGFIDMHPHWNDIRRGVLDPDNNWDFAANLAYGVTTGRDPQTFTFDTLAYQDLVDMGEAIGPRAYSTGPGVFVMSDFQSYEETRDYLATYKRYYKIDYLKSYLVGNRRQRQWVVQAAKELHIMPTMEGHSDTELQLTHLLDGFSGLEHSMTATPLFKDVVQAMAQSSVTYTPTLIVAYGGPLSEDYFYEHIDVQHDVKLRRFVPNHILDAMTRRRPIWSSDAEYVFKRLATEDKKLVDAGARVTIGSHGALQGMSYHWEMWLLASGGLSPMEVLRSATLRGAEGMGLAQDLGSIEAGKLADLLILAKDPLSDIHNTNSIKYVMKDGRLYNGDTLDQIWPDEQKRPEGWWTDDAPVQKRY